MCSMAQNLLMAARPQTSHLLLPSETLACKPQKDAIPLHSTYLRSTNVNASDTLCACLKAVLMHTSCNLLSMEPTWAEALPRLLCRS